MRFRGLTVDFKLICGTRVFPGPFPVSRLPRGVTVAQVTLDHFVMVRIHARQMSDNDLRHLFATRCVEAGVDIPTVSRWLNHQDGGALAMKTYGAPAR